MLNINLLSVRDVKRFIDSSLIGVLDKIDILKERVKKLEIQLNDRINILKGG